jgi:hypothetical protein
MNTRLLKAIDCLATVSGKKLQRNQYVLHNLAIDLQYLAIKKCEELGCTLNQVLSAAKAIKRRWGHGYPGIPTMVIRDVWGANPNQVSDLAALFLAGVLLFVDRAIVIDSRKRASNSITDRNVQSGAIYFQAAEESFFMIENISNAREIEIRDGDSHNHPSPDLMALVRSELGKAGAMAKLANDPKQAAKTQVRECWLIWQQSPTRYKTKSAFAKDMMAKFEELDNQAVISRWCGKWEAESVNSTLLAE